LSGVPAVCAGAFIVKDGQPLAQIVIAERPSRTVKLAASELQACIEKISGAQLAIASAPGNEFPVKIYVGRSAFTEKQGIDDKGLDDGAFRMKSGENWLVLLGRDDDFVPREPYTVVGGGPSEPDRLRMLAEWDKRSGSFYGTPGGDLGRQYNRAQGLWAYDEFGSLNAVNEFLRRVGMR
jgi:hypothetical protein